VIDENLIYSKNKALLFYYDDDDDLDFLLCKIKQARIAREEEGIVFG
jgi:hypothetical protein